MTNAQVVETSATINKSPIQEVLRSPGRSYSTYYEMTPGFKPFTTTTIFLCENEGTACIFKFATKLATRTTTIITIIIILLYQKLVYK